MLTVGLPTAAEHGVDAAGRVAEPQPPVGGDTPAGEGERELAGEATGESVIGRVGDSGRCGPAGEAFARAGEPAAYGAVPWEVGVTHRRCSEEAQSSAPAAC